MKFVFALILTFTTYYASADEGGWTQKSGVPAEGRHRTTGWSIGNKGYIGLGHYNSGPMGNIAKADVWEYDPTQDSWTQKADYGGGPTYGAIAFTIENYAYVGAHVYGGNEYYKFDPIQNSWTLITPCPNGQADRTAFTINGKGYALTSSSVYEYDPQTDTWTLKGPTPISIGAWSKSFVVGEKAYILASGSGLMYEYKPSTHQFVQRTAYPGDAIGGWVTFETADKGYVATGYISFLNPTSRQIWEFDPALNAWNQYEDLPGSTRRFAASFSINGKGYVGTGTNGNNFKDFWEFNPQKALTIDQQEKVEVQAFPNPSTDIINISIPAHISAERIDVYDMTGRLVYYTTDIHTNTQLNKNDFGSGTYIYYVSNSRDLICSGKLIFE